MDPLEKGLSFMGKKKIFHEPIQQSNLAAGASFLGE
jgi:hypothetical protein